MYVISGNVYCLILDFSQMCPIISVKNLRNYRHLLRNNQTTFKATPTRLIKYKMAFKGQHHFKLSLLKHDFYLLYFVEIN